MKAGVLKGWIWDPGRPTSRIEAEIIVDGTSIGSFVADRRRGDLARAGIGDGAHGFEAFVPAAFRDGQAHAVVLKAASGRKLHAVDTRSLAVTGAPNDVSGRVEGVRAGRLIGWAWDRANASARVELELRVAGAVAATVVADSPRGDLAKSKIGDGRHAFKFALDALPHEVRAVGEILVVTSPEFGGVTLGAVHLAGAAEGAPDGPGMNAATARQPAKPRGGTPPSAPGGPSVTAAKASPGAPSEDSAPAARSSGGDQAGTDACAIAAPASTDAPPKLSAKDAIESATSAESKGDLDQARALLDTVLAGEPKNFEALYRRARIALALGDTLGAKRFAGDALLLKRNHPKACLTLARVAEADGQRALALEYWKHVPPSESAYRERLLKSARMLAALERPDEAIAALEQAVAQKPKDAAGRRALAQMAEDLAHTNRAVEQWDALSELSPGDPEPAAKRARLLSGRRSDAMAAILRYRGAMRHTGDPLALGVGGSLSECLRAGPLVTALARHFGASVDVVVAAPSAAAVSVFQGHPDVRRVVAAHEANATYELALLLPEFSLFAEGGRPWASLRYEFVEMRSLRSGSPVERQRAYAAWVSELVGLPGREIEQTRFRMERAPEGEDRGDGCVLLVKRGGRGGWSGHADLAAALQERRRRCETVDLSAARETGDAALDALGAMSTAAAVVCDDEAVAGLAAAMRVPVLCVAAARSGEVVRLAAPDAVVLEADAPCGACATAGAASLWQAGPGACGCLASIGARDVLSALEPLLPATAAPERPDSARPLPRPAATRAKAAA